MNALYPISVLHLNNIGVLYVNILLPSELRNNKEKLKGICFRHKCDDGNLTIEVKNFFSFSFCLNKNVSVINMRSSTPKIINSGSMLQIKYNVTKNAISNDKIYNKFDSSGIKDVIMNENNNEVYLHRIRCRKCNSVLFDNSDSNEMRIVFDINIKRLDDNINEMFICFEEMSLVKEQYDKVQMKLKNKINIDIRYVWINYSLYQSNAHIKNDNENFRCNNCNEMIGSFDNETLNDAQYAKFDLTKIILDYKDKSKIYSIDDIVNESYIKVLLHKAITDNKPSISFSHNNKLIVSNITMNVLTQIKMNYNDKNISNKQYYAIFTVDCIMNKEAHYIDDVYQIEVEEKDIINILKIIENNNKEYKEEIDNYSIINNINKQLYILQL